jgi:23S rRNA pseudouridine2605 synthase
MARAGIASRRDAETMILAGRVSVNGETLTSPARNVTEGDRILVDGEPMPSRERSRLWIFHKPRGVVTTARDPEGRQTVFDILPEDLPRVVAVGRLDINTEGLLLLTNDGEWAERVLHPRYEVEREYAVGLRRPLDEDAIAALGRGIPLEEGLARFAGGVRHRSPAETRRLTDLLDPPADPDLIWYGVVLRQGWKRQVRRMLAAVGSPVARLVRVRMGPAKIDGLGSGRIRRLRHEEIDRLAGLQPSSDSRRRRGPGRRPARRPGGPRRS